MKWILHLLWKHRLPRHCHEFIRGDLKSRLGYTRRDAEFVIEFLNRKKFGKWETFAKFRYVDIPSVKQHLTEAEKAMQWLITTS
jgi:hypothetical protein